MELLRLKPDRAHDALNDARNTVRVCGSMDLERCMEEYCLRYIDYGPDRLAGRVGGLPYPDLPAAQADPQLTALTCPYCGQPLTLGEWTRKDGNTLLAYARCNEGDEYLTVCRYGRTPEGIRAQVETLTARGELTGREAQAVDTASLLRLGRTELGAQLAAAEALDDVGRGIPELVAAIVKDAGAGLLNVIFFVCGGGLFFDATVFIEQNLAQAVAI